MSGFKAPEVRVGDSVLFYSDPFSDKCRPYVAWVLAEAIQNDAVNLLVFTDTVGFVEKAAIRNRNNPTLRQKPSIAAMGGWDLTPHTKDLQQLKALKIAAITESEKAHAGTKNSRSKAEK